MRKEFADRLELRFSEVFRPKVVVSIWEAGDSNLEQAAALQSGNNETQDLTDENARFEAQLGLESKNKDFSIQEMASELEEYAPVDYEQDYFSNFQSSDELDGGSVTLDGHYSDTESMVHESYEIFIDDELMKGVEVVPNENLKVTGVALNDLNDLYMDID
ncbi:OLC1v1027011C1 [Oldenlandia corymbosa var. corymbosa]|uniref:OLC1v1027011C1 n=1 Tax=Oldenlandia corymbosa var. corymbosa TaxID=529605 RepID=A0AAV1C8F9_OLDCO|nr:OLC1v1027011C1 [Oldenlandia corymbosa var. corymbosa]